MQSFAWARRAARRAAAFAACMAGVAFLIGAVTATGASAGAMLTGGLTSQPIGHYDFCKANPSECAIRTRDTRPEPMSGALWSLLRRVNLAVNEEIRPMNDLDIYGRDEVWAYPDTGVGDCEDYVLEKRRRLVDSGLSIASLPITVVRKPDGEGHAVLTVRTDRGDFVLDNLTNAIRPWNQTGYRYLKRQSAEHTGRWVTIREGAAPLVGSVQ